MTFLTMSDLSEEQQVFINKKIEEGLHFCNPSSLCLSLLS
jgi:hypothetical protein